MNSDKKAQDGALDAEGTDGQRKNWRSGCCASATALLEQVIDAEGGRTLWRPAARSYDLTTTGRVRTG